MDEVISNYILAFDEINAMTAYSYQTADNLSAAEKSKQIAVDTSLMYEAIFIMIEGKTFEDRVLDHVMESDISGLQRLVESEYHRVYNTAIEDGGMEYTNESNEIAMKTWSTVKDEKVRETHSYLEGQSVPVGSEFYTFDGDHALYPGGFTKAENNINK